MNPRVHTVLIGSVSLNKAQLKIEDRLGKVLLTVTNLTEEILRCLKGLPQNDRTSLKGEAKSFQIKA